MGRRRFDRAFKLEAVKLVRDRGVSASQAARDLDVHENVLRKWVKEFAADPQHAFPGQGQMKPEQLEIERLRREVVRLKAERDILKKATVSSTGQRNGRCELSRRGYEAKSFSRASVELTRDSVQIVLAIAG